MKSKLSLKEELGALRSELGKPEAPSQIEQSKSLKGSWIKNLDDIDQRDDADDLDDDDDDMERGDMGSAEEASLPA